MEKKVHVRGLPGSRANSRSGREKPFHTPFEKSFFALKDDLKFNPGFISVKPSGDKLRRFETLINEFDEQKLIAIIRNATKHGTEEDRGYIEKALESVHLSCPDESKRSSGSPTRVHYLRTGALMAAIYAPASESDRVAVVPTATALFHDLPEDTLDPGKPEVKFRANVGGNLIECGTREEIEKAIYDIFNDDYKPKGERKGYGKHIYTYIHALTRWGEEPKKHDGLLYHNKEWQSFVRKAAAPFIEMNLVTPRIEEYWDYYAVVVQKVVSALAKAADNKMNWLDLTIENEYKKNMLRNGLIYKTIPQINFWKYTSWVIFEMLLSGFDKHAAGTPFENMERKLRMPSEADIALFKQGYAILGKRNVKPDAILDGSPIIVLYKRKNKYELEAPFEDFEGVVNLVAAGFGKTSRIKRAYSLFPDRIGHKVIVSFESDIQECELQPALKKMVPIYDRDMSKHFDFERQDYAVLAEENRAGRLKR